MGHYQLMADLMSSVLFYNLYAGSQPVIAMIRTNVPLIIVCSGFTTQETLGIMLGGVPITELLSYLLLASPS